MTGRAQLNYSSRDYESLRRELLARIPRLTDRWTDFNASDLGVVLLELFCGVGDMLAYYLDVQASEAFLPTARQRQNVINLCKLIGYRLDGPVAATTELKFSLSQPRSGAFVVPAGTAARARLDDGEIWFESVEDATIPKGALSASAGARQGKRREEIFESSGEPGQVLSIASTAIAQDSVRVAVQGTPWFEVRHFQDSDADSQHFQVETDALDRTRIFFGDGRSGAIPRAGDLVSVSVLETLGEGGNLGAGLVTEVVSEGTRAIPRPPVTVTNVLPATGGASRESIPHARAQAPAELRSLWKAVTHADFLALARGFPGVAKAQVVDINDCASLRYFQVNLAVAPNGGGLPSPLLKRDLLEFLESRKVVTVEVRIFDPEYRPVAIEGELFVLPGEDEGLVRTRAEAALEEHFSFADRAFGQGVYLSGLMALLDGVPGVSHVDLFAPMRDIPLRPGQIATLGTVLLATRRAAL
jgi:hypothetical protein